MPKIRNWNKIDLEHHRKRPAYAVSDEGATHQSRRHWWQHQDKGTNVFVIRTTRTFKNHSTKPPYADARWYTVTPESQKRFPGTSKGQDVAYKYAVDWMRKHPKGGA